MPSIGSHEEDIDATDLNEGHDELFPGEEEEEEVTSMTCDDIVPPDGGGTKLSADGSSQFEGSSTVLISQNFEIDIDSPAAEAIRAVSDTCTKVSRVEKAKLFFNQSMMIPTPRNKAKMCKSFIDPSANILAKVLQDDKEAKTEESVKETTRADKAVEYDLSGNTNKPTLRDRYGKSKGISFLSHEKSFRNTSKKKSKNVKGKAIEREHELYTLSIAMMLGLRYAIYNSNIELRTGKDTERKWLRSEEFMHAEKYVFRPDGKYDTPPHKLGLTFKFKDYAPLPFAYIRRMFGINEYEFIDSICADANFIEFISNSKSGQFFFYSSDGKYMIKTMSITESKFLRRILPHYFQHCAQNPNTLITRFLGMYKVKLSRLQRNVIFVIMNSVFDTDKTISSFYDLKGSVVGRNAQPGEAVKKDNDVRRMIEKNPNSAFLIPPGRREIMREQVISDCNFLKAMEIFDYSMLIGVHYIPPKSKSLNDFSIRGLTFRRNMPVTRSIHSCSSIISEVSLHESHAKRLSKSMVEGIEPSLLNTFPELRLKQIGLHLDKDSNRLLLVENNDKTYVRSVRNMKCDDNEIDCPDDSALQEELIIEQSYWPFHRFYQVNGKFRKQPMNEAYRRVLDEKQEEDIVEAQTPEVEANCASCFGDLKKHEQDIDVNGDKKIQLNDFVKPISNRKDCGIAMDDSSIELPMKVTVGDQEEECDGQIFYMGIIDVLQQFNVRKRGEASYKKYRGMDGASCIHPDLYADRFIRFFDEYTQKKEQPSG
eukprot:CAMPEP_0203670428 /NCGR_PEP_ID=MMETSP0090-20130426/6508_1 /ASSEMBLY_ACC=CAM_ASM_001088 /TAXON_ID=426623 /ORGANISM="Chaetoceros affinis, Strain CCMP159" /LENGTH=764 /DNA_ID=CAMNT_0050535289 /DNA_START=24 /DNA_END=2318 /DNA_ORIENTATION=-